jgi:dihydroorotate dehydrogenase electron transfer subunit
MIQTRVKLIKNIEVSAGYCKIILSCPGLARLAKPGQFIEIKVTDNHECLLRRPFSIHRAYGSNIEILFEIIGKGTEFLSQKKRGESLDIIGPLGNGFKMGAPEHPFDFAQGRQGTLPARQAGRAPVLVAGGMGVAPLVFLAEKLAEVKSQKSKVKNIVLIGAKTKNQILCEKEFKKLGCEIKISTDDGSRGFKGKVTELLKHLPSTIPACPCLAGRRAADRDYRLSTIYACGPKPMLKEISVFSKKYNIPAQISLEEHMACGFGACLGCVVNTIEGYKRVCKEGPVFGAREIIWA